MLELPNSGVYNPTPPPLTFIFESSSSSKEKEIAIEEKPKNKPRRRRIRRKNSDLPNKTKRQDLLAESEKNNPAVVDIKKSETKIKSKRPTASDKKLEPEIKTENTYNPNVTIVGETKSDKPSEGRGGWWNKITGN